MVLHGGGPGPRKRVVLGDVMWNVGDNGIVDWNSKATEASREEDFQTAPEIVDGGLNPPLRTGDDLDCDSDDDLYDASEEQQQEFEQHQQQEQQQEFEHQQQEQQQHVDPVGGGFLDPEPPILFNLDASRDPAAADGEQVMEGVEEEVADSELAATQPGSSVGDDDGVDIGFDELLDLLKEKPSDLPPADLGPTMSQPGPDLELASSSGFSRDVSESFNQPSSDGKQKGFMSSSEQLGLQRLAQQMEDDDDDVLCMGPSSTQDSSLSQPGLLSPRLTTHNFMQPSLSSPLPDLQAGSFSDQMPTRRLFGLDFEDSRHSAPPALQLGNEDGDNPFGSSLHLSVLDDNADEQSSHNMVFRDASTTLEHGLALQPHFHHNIDQDRPSQSSGSVLASEGNFAGSIHTVDSARMARSPPSAAVAAQKQQVMSSRDVHILLSDSDSDSGIDNGDFMLLDKQEFFSPSGKFKRRAQDALAAHSSKKRPNIQGASSQVAMYEALRSEITSAQVSEWQKGQLPLDEVVSKSWNHVASQMQYLNPSGLQPLPSTYGSTGFSLNYSPSLVAGRSSVQYSKHTVEAPIPNSGNARPLGVTYDLNAKNQQVVRSVPATAKSIMTDTLAGNNQEEDTPPEGELSVPLLKHQRVALAWMKNREKDGSTIGTGILQGGILADDQGLGKTISTISLILKERAPIKKAPTTKISSEALCVEVLDDGDDFRVPGKAPAAALPSTSTSASHDKSSLPSKPGDSGAASSAQKSQPDVVAVSSKFRPAAGTLVVCPTSVLRQWHQEIKEKVTEKAGLRVLIYHGSNRTRDPEELVKYDVVLTTYSIVSMEVPKQPLPEEKDGDNKDGPPPCRTASKTKKPKKTVENGKKGRGNGKGRLVESENGSVDSGPLARVNWFRVVLDEAQSIKNARTQGARAAWGLRSKRRWCLSGTPIQNAIDDLYSYFRFLRYSPFDSYKKFRELIKEPVTRTPSHGYANLLRLLTPVMLRRTKATKIDGQPIVKLPARIVSLKQAEFSEEERAFYNNLENESRKQFQDYAAAGTLQSNYVNILWMLLRLRQACDHPLLVKGDHHQSTQKVILDSAKKLSVEKRHHLLSLLEGNRDICPICSDLPDEAVVCVCTHVFCRQCISEQLATGDDPCCPVPKCRKSLNTSLVFTLAALKSPESGEGSSSSSSRESSSLLVNTLHEDQSTEFAGWKSSSKIDAVIDTLNALPVVSEVELKDEPVVETSKDLEELKLDDSTTVPSVLDRQESMAALAAHVADVLIKGEPDLVAETEVESSSFETVPKLPCLESAAPAVKAEMFECGQDDAMSKPGTVLTRASSSADIKPADAVLNHITTTTTMTTVARRNVLTEKAIVFSQWTSMLDLLEAKLKEAKFNYRRLDGTMSVLARDRAVSEFKTLPEVNVIIMSLKAASLGLNMVAASHVLLLDVWWNPTTEDQAIDRAHRIGQTRPVNVSRFTVKDTIEDRILELQEKKRHMVASAFGESQGGGNGHLSTAELDYLFNGENRGFNR